MDKALFSQLPLPETQLANLESLGYAAMTPIQAQALPAALQGKDVIGQAKTGSGKTAAFGIALLHTLDLGDPATQALVLCPTRELSIQVSTELRRLARFLPNVKIVTLYGGQILAVQKASLKQGAHVVVGTPGRIQDHLNRESLALDSVRTLVLDEADKMLEMGFQAEIEAIASALPKNRQTLLFSATYPENIQTLSERFQSHPNHIRIEDEAGASDIKQSLCPCSAANKLDKVTGLLCNLAPASTIIFCNTKEATREVTAHLQAKGFSVTALNGDLEQRDREKIFIQFKHLGCRVLVATDVAARGLDIEDLSLVINFEAPHEPASYVHRIGRTGRAGKSGRAVTFFSSNEKHKIDAIRDALGIDIPTEPPSSFADGSASPLVADRVTLCIAAGRKNKIRAGDILGALTGEHGIEGGAVGKIDVLDYDAYVTVERSAAKKAFARLSDGKIKGHKYRIRML